MPAKTLSLPTVPAADYIQAIALHVSSVCVITTALAGERVVVLSDAGLVAAHDVEPTTVVLAHDALDDLGGKATVHRCRAFPERRCLHLMTAAEAGRWGRQTF